MWLPSLTVVTRTSSETFPSSQQNWASSLQIPGYFCPPNEGDVDFSADMSGFFTGILNICLLVSVPVSGQDVNEERIDQSLPFNKSLLIYNEASENLENAIRTIADLNEAMKETTKLKNEVNTKQFFVKVFINKKK